VSVSVPATSRVASYSAPNAEFDIVSYPLRPLEPGEALVKVSMSTICRSDIHSYEGHRPSPCPALPGHEIVGSIVALGRGLTHDMRGERLGVGDRVTWSEYFIPGDDYFSEVLDLPQKARGVEKYGHMSATTPPHHHGGFAEYCYILPKSWILRLPDVLSDAEAAPLNCGVATMVAVTEAADIRLGSTVVIQGLGLLGLYGAALAKSRGARLVIGIDSHPGRRELASRFGVDVTLDAAIETAVLQTLMATHCAPAGPDAVIEVCGAAQAVAVGLDLVRTGGTFVLAGLVSPGAMATIDASTIVRKMVSIRGVHNYHPRHLIEALDFVLANRSRFPFIDLVDARYPLEQATLAMRDAASRRVLRAAIVP
jgi:putative phosphonate catabolism associated alcohol dehydrogenase